MLIKVMYVINVFGLDLTELSVFLCILADISDIDVGTEKHQFLLNEHVFANDDVYYFKGI